MNNLLSVLSAFPAVYEVLADAYRPSTSGSEIEEAVTNREAFSAPVSIMVSRALYILNTGRWVIGV